VAKSSLVDCGTEFVPPSVSITTSRRPPTRRVTVTSSGTTKQSTSSSEPFETNSGTSGSNCYHWRSLPTTTPSTISHCCHPSGRPTISILQCSFSLQKTTDSYDRSRQTHGWKAWKRLSEFSWQKYTMLRSYKPSTPAEKR
jgi:hypothetical protein